MARQIVVEVDRCRSDGRGKIGCGSTVVDGGFTSFLPAFCVGGFTTDIFAWEIIAKFSFRVKTEELIYKSSGRIYAILGY